MDDATLTYHLIRGFKAELQDAWGMDGSDSQDPQFVANWAIQKETKMAAINTCVMGQSAKKRLHLQEPHEIRMGPFDPRTTTREIQWSWMLPKEDRGSTSRPKNTNEG